MDEEYIHYQECLTSLNRAWCIVCELEKTEANGILWSAAYRMALIEYCKPYKKSNGGGKRKYSLPIPDLSEAESDIHKRVIIIRDTAYAHSDINIKEAKVYVGTLEDKALPLIVSNKDANGPTPTELRMLIEKTLDQLYLKQEEYEAHYNNQP